MRRELLRDVVVLALMRGVRPAGTSIISAPCHVGSWDCIPPSGQMPYKATRLDRTFIHQRYKWFFQFADKRGYALKLKSFNNACHASLNMRGQAISEATTSYQKHRSNIQILRILRISIFTNINEYLSCKRILYSKIKIKKLKYTFFQHLQ